VSLSGKGFCVVKLPLNMVVTSFISGWGMLLPKELDMLLLSMVVLLTKVVGLSLLLNMLEKEVVAGRP
jgi:hypothetical protein